MKKKGIKEKKIIPKKEKKIYTEKKKDTTKNQSKKNINQKVNKKKYKLKPMEHQISDEEKNEDEHEDEVEIEDNEEVDQQDIIESEESDETEMDTENEEYESEKEDDDVEENEDDDDYPETQSFFEEKIQKKKKTSKNDVAKINKTMKNIKLFEGWQKNDQIATKNIDFPQWLLDHPTRDPFFIGPDHYIYNNASSMKKFVEVLAEGTIDEKTVSIPIPPMNKVVSTNPRMVIGLTGSRYIEQNGGYRVSPVFYISKEYVSSIYFF